jgi:ApeA N-terminal domain 1
VTQYLSDSAEWWGHFWLSGAEQATPGVLSYTPDRGPVLSVIGELIPRGQRRLPVVYGFADNTPITLLDRFNEGGRVQGFVTAKQKISAQQALVGINLDNDATEAFVGIDIRVENLTEWGAQSPISYGDVEEGQPWRWQVIIEPVEPDTAQLEGVTAELHTVFHPPGDYDRRSGGLNLAAHASSLIRFESQKPRKLDDWLDFVDMVQDLVSLEWTLPVRF